ncbi:type ISP restriction/modification enzyme [Flavobacterium cellulosilyticum]|uniref:Type ISP restriction-modification enzyme LLaBIII C-terminal specificity domain-containing protein n=1 Tax=Flavobacterium cellulosilyticum TaxID=2541731 RepID=A0A4R5CMD5_9FLAO|nr:type ISP restriction/modification enzyme [Flavobacterium cellulosilyticum]TDD98684.1 hypothetical protein E0F76_06035 [Flavobacterium cellulosilyticum]
MELKPIPTEITNKIAKQLGLTFVPEKEAEGNVCMANSNEVRPEFREIFSTIDLLDYIYAALHSPTNQEKNKEIANSDYIKISFPKDTKTFWESVALGSKVRQKHLVDNPIDENYFTEFTVDGAYIVVKQSF